MSRAVKRKILSVRKKVCILNAGYIHMRSSCLTVAAKRGTWGKPHGLEHRCRHALQSQLCLGRKYAETIAEDNRAMCVARVRDQCTVQPYHVV